MTKADDIRNTFLIGMVTAIVAIMGTAYIILGLFEIAESQTFRMACLVLGALFSTPAYYLIYRMVKK